MRQPNALRMRTTFVPRRRDFARLGTLSLAARFAPALNAQVPQKRIGYAVIGLGRIAGHFMPGSRLTTNSQIAALVSGHRDKADRIAAIQRAFFASGNNAAVWEEGWYFSVVAAQIAAGRATPVSEWWGAGSASVLVLQGAEEGPFIERSSRGDTNSFVGAF